MKKTKGFTLIEILLVIAIATILLLAIVKTMQERAHELLIQKASQQMQALLQASLDFYVKNNQWPGTVTFGQAGSDLQNAGFIPNVTGPGNPLIGPWGGGFVLCPAARGNAGCTNPPPSPAEDVVFRVSLNMPSGLTPVLAQAMASQISSLLPNGYVTNGANCPETGGGAVSAVCAVAQIDIPGEQLDKSSYVKYTYLVTGNPDNCNNTYDPTRPSNWPPATISAPPQIPDIQCPPNFVKQIFASPASFASPSPTLTEGENAVRPLNSLYVIPVANSTIPGWNIYIFGLGSPDPNSGSNQSVFPAPICDQSTYAFVITKCCDPQDSHSSCYQQTS